MIHSKRQLRRILREKRRHINLIKIQEARDSVVKKLCQLPQFVQSQAIAIYLSHENEIDLSPLIQLASNMQKTLYLPVINETLQSTMEFHAYKAGDLLMRNRFNILEPVNCTFDTLVDAMNLDLVLIPLVGFDTQGIRLGRGGGYYDKAFSLCIQEPCKNCPALVGVAYEFQRVKEIQAEKTDMTLDVVVTEENIYYFNETK